MYAKTYCMVFTGLVPVIQHLKYGGRILESLETLDTLENYSGKGWIEVSVAGMFSQV